MSKKKYDFGGWATRNNLRCSDGRTIMQNAFADQDGERVPLVWNHDHSDPFNVLGHAILENRDNGVYAYCTFNDNEQGRNAKELVKHGDVTALSIYANKLKQDGGNVLHGAIREVSLVLAGANPGAFIDSVSFEHAEEGDDVAIIYTGENIESSNEENVEAEEKSAENLSHSDDDTETKEKEVKGEMEKDNRTVQDVIDTMNEEQKKVLYALVGMAAEGVEAGQDDEEGEEDMKHNLFDNEDMEEDDVLSHADQEVIFSDAKRIGSLKESVLQHSQQYGIENIEYLFPEDHELNNAPEFVKRPDGWVSKVMGAVKHVPFSRIRSTFANITEDEARAKGYVKGKLKKEEVFGLLRRSTTPQTVYKKQKLDRDDVIDITDFNVVAWLKTEMRMMLNEELSRAFLVGDGRSSIAEDKISEEHIRPIWTDDDFYTIKSQMKVDAKTEGAVAKEFIKNVIRSRKNYRGTGNPVLYTTEDMLIECLLLTDTTGRDLYDLAKLKTKLRVSDIVTVPVMEGLTRNGKETEAERGKKFELLGLIVNLSDYAVGADKGGAVNMFDDFDIDYNQEKYLIETRCSGALVTPYSAIAIENDVTLGA